MTKKRTKSDANRNNKKKIVMGDNRKTLKPQIVIAAVIALALLGGVGYAIYSVQGQSVPVTASTAYEPQQANATSVSYPLDLFNDGQAHHFEHKVNGQAIRYFILKSSDGIVRAAFDACDVCWPEGKGYVQSGDEMVCRNCGRRFASVMINEVQGGCNPAPLHRTVEGDHLVIQINDILTGQQYFNFKGRA